MDTSDEKEQHFAQTDLIMTMLKKAKTRNQISINNLTKWHKIW